MKQLMVALLAAAAFAAPASAEDMSVRELIRQYRGYDGAERLAAVSYLTGLGLGYMHGSVLTEMRTGKPLFCFPPRLKIDAALTASALEGLVREMPQVANEEASTTLAFAFMRTFPCKS
jgi:uncharacterized protein YbjT (DUF2867 family)